MTLPEYIAAHLAKPFAWGENDCVTFAIGWLNCSTGRNYLACLPQWKTAREAIRTVNRVGGLRAAIDRELSAVHPNLARDGAIALIEERTTGIVSGPHVVCVGFEGLVFIDRQKILCAWHY